VPRKKFLSCKSIGDDQNSVVVIAAAELVDRNFSVRKTLKNASLDFVLIHSNPLE
jgi:hypothetical protein